MNKIIVMVAAVACAAVACADETTAQKKPRIDRFARRAARIAAEGGQLVRPYAGKVIAIVNDQKRVAEKDFFKDKQNSIEGLLGYPVKILPPKSDVSKAAVVITVSDDKSAPSLLIAPEIPWAGINVAALAADNPKDEVLASRLQKEIWRAFVFCCGAGNAMMQPCVMRTVSKPANLDAYPNIVPSPDFVPRVAKTAQELGIGSTSTCTYREACQEGWAPAPTNDLQKTIWEEVHNPPAKPMKITYDSAAQKGKVTQ